MARLTSKLDPAAAEYGRRRAWMAGLVEELRAIEERVAARSRAGRPRDETGARLTVRERVAALLDPGAPFLELSSLAGLGMHDDDGRDAPTGGGCVCGVGLVAGVRVVTIANDPGIKGGTITPMGLRKSLRAQEIALENRLPIVSLVESGGANLLHQSELFVEGGRVFRNMARASAAGLPQITVVHGSSTAGGAYLPGLSDYVIVVRDRAKVFLAGPPLVKAAIGEDADEERLGGAMLHAAVTGSAEYVADDDAHAIRLARELVSHLGWRVAEPPAHAPAPRLDAEELLGVVPIDRGTPWDVREIVGRIVDDSEFLELAPDFGRATVCGHAAIEGIACGIVGNNGPFDPDGSCKAAHFVQLCHQAGLPIVYLQNTPGFLVGTDAERRGAIKHGSKLIQAVANAAVPQVTLLVGGGYGAGNYAMCGRALDPRFVFAWPNSRVAVMGGGQAAMVMKTVALAKQARSGTPADPAALDQAAAALRERIDRESSALFATARVWDDGIIDPRDSRRVLGLCLATSAPVDRRNPNRTSFGVARM